MTIEDHLTKIRRDLAALVTFLNKDESYSVASEAQAALHAVAGLSNTAADHGIDELEWPDRDEDIQVQSDD